MSTFPYLTVTLAIPAAGALVLAVTPGAPGGASDADKRARNELAKCSRCSRWPSRSP
jgi:hypothetical protein